MKYKNLFDTHTHSIDSFDGYNTYDEMCEAAISMGVIGIAITDHCDADAMGMNHNALAALQHRHATEAKAAYGDRITFLQGIELGQGIYRRDESTNMINNYDYDIVIGSMHNLEDLEDFYYLDYKRYNVPRLLEEYFESELELVEWDMVDTLAHLTYPLRYIVGRDKIDVDISQFYTIIDRIFDTLIRNGKAIEINTSGLFMEMAQTLPDPALIKRYYDRGGRLITVGSDAHISNRICAGFDTGYDILRDIGFKEFTIFEHREAKQIPLV